MFLNRISRIVLSFLYLISRIIPLSWGYRLCAFLGVIACKVMSKQRKVVMDNLTIAFGDELPLSKRENICRGMFIEKSL